MYVSIIYVILSQVNSFLYYTIIQAVKILINLLNISRIEKV